MLAASFLQSHPTIINLTLDWWPPGWDWGPKLSSSLSHLKSLREFKLRSSNISNDMLKGLATYMPNSVRKLELAGRHASEDTLTGE